VRWLPVASITFIVLLIVIVGICFAQGPMDDQGWDPSDSLSTEVPDSLSAAGLDSLGAEIPDAQTAEGTERPRRRGSGRRRPGQPDSLWSQGLQGWLGDTHPTYKVSISKRKDVTNWDTKIALQKRLSEKVSMSMTATLQTRENSTLNRSDSNDGTSATLRYNLNDDIKFGLSYNSSINAYRFSLKHEEPDDRKRKQDISISSELTKTISDAIDLRLKTIAGSTENSFSSVSNRGSKQDMSASLTFSPTEDFRTSANYTAKRMLLDSQVDSSGTAVFTSKDRTFSQNISFGIDYKIMRGVSLNLDASRSDQRRQHPDPREKKQETEGRSSRRAAASSAFDLFDRLTWDVSVSFSESNTEFVLQDTRGSKITGASLNASAKLLPWRGATLNLGGKRDVNRNDYQTVETGDDVQKSVSLKLTQDLGQRADLNVTALSDMVSVFYDDKDENPKDRDRLNNRISLDIGYKPLGSVSTRLGGEFSEENLVYVKAASSANNRTTRKYIVSGNYRLSTVRSIEITQNYNISAVYTYYHFGESKNTLVRDSNVQTRFQVPVTGGLKLSLNHNYKFRDQGSYREEGSRRLYGKAAEKETQLFNIGCNYSLGKLFRIVVRQVYTLQRSWEYPEGEKVLDYETTTTEISGRVGFDYKFGDNTKISLTVEQNRKEGSRVGEAFKSYRNIEFEASHVF
jgi:hypothetical protein